MVKLGLVFPGVALGLTALVAVGCGGRTPLGTGGCFEAAPTCVVPGDPCEPASLTSPVCDEAQKTWSCPPGSSVYQRAVDAPGVCLPFHDPNGPLRSLRGSLPRVPLDDGRCLWIGEDVVTTSGDTPSNIGFLVSQHSTYGGCPTSATFAGGAPTSVVTIDGPADPSLVVQIAGGYRLHGRTRVLYRLFRQDPSATFGVTLLGSGLGRWDAPSQHIVVPGVAGLRWGPDLDLGDASLVQDDYAYVYGCHAPFHELTDDCEVGRLDDGDAMMLYAGPGSGVDADWVSSARGADGAIVFDSASWFSSVFRIKGAGLEHAYIVAWGSTVQTHTSPNPEGPWVAGPNLAQCDLPADDAHAYCSSLVMHQELRDPTRGGENVMTYGNGTLATDQAARYGSAPEKYWPRLVWSSE